MQRKRYEYDSRYWMYLVQYTGIGIGYLVFVRVRIIVLYTVSTYYVHVIIMDAWTVISITRFDESGGKINPRRARGMINPPCEWESKVQTRMMFLKGKTTSARHVVCLFPMRANKEPRTGKIPAAFFRDDVLQQTGLNGWMLTREQASPTQDLHRRHGRRYYIFPYICMTRSWEACDCWSKLIGAWFVHFVAESAGRG